MRAFLARFVDALNTHDAARLGALYSERATLTAYGDAVVEGRTEVARAADAGFARFADSRHGVRRAWTIGDVVIAELVTTGTHQGEYRGIPATGRRVGWFGVSIFWVDAQGQILEEHRYADQLTIVGQLSAESAEASRIPELPLSTEWHSASGTASERDGAELARSALEMIESEDVAKMDALHAADVEWQDMTAPEPIRGRAALNARARGLAAKFEGLTLTHRNVWPIEDFVVMETTISGIPRSAAARSRMTIHGLDIIQHRDRQWARGWVYHNRTERG